MFNTWLPGGIFFDFNTGVTHSVVNLPNLAGNIVACQQFVIPDAQSGFGVTFDQITPPFNLTKPPKVSYSSTADMLLVMKDQDDWLWAAPCRKQDVVRERGWSWDKFTLHTTQDVSKEGLTPPTTPATGVIKAFQFSGAEGVHADPLNPSDPIQDTPQTINIQYISSSTPLVANAGDIRKFVVTDTLADAHVLKIGRVELVGGTRKPIEYLGAVPFGLQQNGPRNRLSTQPYKGPLVAGYQSGTPWIISENNEKLAKMLEFMEDAQEQFTLRTPGVSGPWMHIYLQALWDCEQNGPIDTWVWDGPDGNPAWDGWQYRALDAMCRTWSEAQTNSNISADNKAALSRICTKFLDWLHAWLKANPTAGGVPDDWRPVGWTAGTPLVSSRGLDPKYVKISAHDCSLALKGAVFAGKAGYNVTKVRYIVHRCILAFRAVQVKGYTLNPEMNGAFTANPDGFEVYGFEQGEILEALALAKQNPTFLIK